MQKAFEEVMDAGLILWVAAGYDRLFYRYGLEFHRIRWNGFNREAGL